MTACSCLKLFDSSNAFIMKFAIVFLATIFFGAMGGKKKEYANVVAVIIDSPFIISLVRILWTLDSWCSCSEFKSYMLINPEHLLYFRIPCECYKEIFSSIVNINNNYLVFIILSILKLFPKFKSFLGNVIGDEAQFCPC